MAEKQLQAERAGGAKTHRQPTAEELKIHEATKADVLRGIRQNHAKTMKKAQAMQNKILYVDKG